MGGGRLLTSQKGNGWEDFPPKKKTGHKVARQNSVSQVRQSLNALQFGQRSRLICKVICLPDWNQGLTVDPPERDGYSDSLYSKMGLSSAPSILVSMKRSSSTDSAVMVTGFSV